MYVCDDRGCVGRNRQRVDDLVESVIVQRLSRPDAADLLLPPADGLNAGVMLEARALRQRLDDATEDYAAGLIDREQMRRVAANLRPRLETAEAAAQSARGPLPREFGDLMGADDVSVVWGGLSIGAKRAVMRELCSVVIRPTRQGAGFDPTSVEIKWLTPASVTAA